MRSGQPPYKLTCWKCFGPHAAQNCIIKTTCTTCKEGDSRNTSHCTKAHNEWAAWKKKLSESRERVASGASAASGSSQQPPRKRALPTTTKGPAKRMRAGDFFNKNNMSKEEKANFIDTMCKFIQHEDEEDEEEEEEETTEQTLNKITVRQRTHDESESEEEEIINLIEVRE